MSPDEMKKFIEKNFERLKAKARNNPDGYAFYLDDASTDDRRLLRATRSSPQSLTKLKLVASTKLCWCHNKKHPDIEVEYNAPAETFRRLIENELDFLSVLTEIKHGRDIKRVVDLKRRHTPEFVNDRIKRIVAGEYLPDSTRTGKASGEKTGKVAVRNSWLFIGNPFVTGFNPYSMEVGSTQESLITDEKGHPRLFAEHFQSVSVGDTVFLYQADPFSSIVGLGRITKDLKTGDDQIIEFNKTVHLGNILRLPEIKRNPELESQDPKIGLEFIWRRPPHGVTLSVVTPRQSQILMEMIAKDNDLTSAKTPSRDALDSIVQADLDAEGFEQGALEGEKKLRFVNYYERRPENRAAAIRIHKTTCVACGFNFQKTYGERGADFIEVHHLKPVHSLEESTPINPATDLTVVCANCHRMIHRDKEHILTIEELKEIIEEQSPK